MEHIEQLKEVLKQIRQEPLRDFETLGETARSAYPLLMELAREGGAEECKLDDLRVALRCNLRRNIIYDSEEEWEEKRVPLVDAIMEAVHAGRDSQIWLRLLQDSLPRNEMYRIIGELQDEQIDRVLFPALEKEAEPLPTGKLMSWYKAMLDRSRQHKAQIYNRLAYYYLWHGEFNSDEELARRYFREMEQQGIERQNPYPGTFGQHGHDEMIRWLLEDGMDEAAEGGPESSRDSEGDSRDPAGSRDAALFQILTGYAKEQLAQIAVHGMQGDFEIDEDEVGTVWMAWLEDPCCRDLRESMRRMYKRLLALPPEEERLMFDDCLRSYGEAIKQLAAGESTQDRRKGIAFLLAMLLNFDNWLLRIIDLEIGPDCTGEQRCEGIRQWLTAIEPFCGKEFIFGDELLVLNSLQENLITYYEKQGAGEDMMRLLEQQVYGADAMVTLSGLGQITAKAYCGHPYCTHNAIALLKLYKDTGEDAKAARLIQDIAKTEDTLPEDLWEGIDLDGRGMLKKKYEALLAGEQEWLDPDGDEDQVDRTDDEEQTDRTGKDKNGKHKKGCKGMRTTSGYIIATRQTHDELWALAHTFRPAPPTLRGDFIRYLYAPPEDGRDWFGITKERRKEMMEEQLKNITTQII